MAAVRTHRYTVAPGNLDRLLEQRATVIRGIRSATPALTATELIRLEDGSYLDIWRWESAEAMTAAAERARDFPLVGQTFALLEEHAIVDGEVLVEL